MRPVKSGKSVRMSYSRQKEVLEMPNLIEIQKDSYQWFLDEGLKEVFEDISPIADFAGHLSLEFVDFTLCKEDTKYTIEECKERDATYAAPLKVKVRLCNKEKDEINEHEIFMGDLPLMTDTGSFVINGAERVIVSQLVRSPGIYYGIGHDKIGKELYTCTVIPNRGAWLEYETDSNDVFYARVDRTRKVPVTVLVRALGFGTNAEILELFGEELAGPWVARTTPDLLEQVKPLVHAGLDAQGLAELSAYLYGDETAALMGYPVHGVPYCAGYACGYHLVRRFLDESGTDIADATLLPAADILDAAQAFWD